MLASAARRVAAGHEPDETSDDRRDERDVRIDDRGPTLDRRHEDDDEDAEARAEDPSDQAHRGALHEELLRDVAPRRSERAAQPDLTRALHDRYERHVGDADRADEQGHAPEHQEEEIEVARHALAHLRELGLRGDLQAIGVVGPQGDRRLLRDESVRPDLGLDHDGVGDAQVVQHLRRPLRDHHRAHQLVDARDVVDDPDDEERVVTDLDRGQWLEAVDAEILRRVLADDGDAVGAQRVTGIEEASGQQLRSHRLEHARCHALHRELELRLTRGVVERHRAHERIADIDLAHRSCGDDAVEAFEARRRVPWQLVRLIGEVDRS